MNKEFLDYASLRYYSGDPIISDEEFDKLAALYDYQSVGNVRGESSDISHAFRLYSLQKCYTDEPLIELGGTIIRTVKLDGAAVALYYVYGRLSLALTRGDGIKGLDITDNIRKLVSDKPEYEDPFEGGGIHDLSAIPLLQITGEVVAPKHIKNARNYAAGALGLKDSNEFASRELHFIAYGVMPQYSLLREGANAVFVLLGTDTGNTRKAGWYEELMLLAEYGFNIVPIADNTSQWDEQFPTDGIVYRTNEYDIFNSAGFTSKHPRGAFALKERKGGVYTTLKEVVWQVGRTGVITPVALIEPVEIGGAIVTKASLHNISYIESLSLEIGCIIEVERAGEIIPRVIKRVDESTYREDYWEEERKLQRNT